MTTHTRHVTARTHVQQAAMLGIAMIGLALLLGRRARRADDR
jgi:LPXTG-motif cell wall-anchored protein